MNLLLAVTLVLVWLTKVFFILLTNSSTISVPDILFAAFLLKKL